MAEQKQKVRKSKTGVTKFTFLLAFLCLVAGFVLPFTDFTFKGANFNNDALVMQLPAALKNFIFGLTGNTINLGFGAESCAFSYHVNFMGLLPEGKFIDIGALFVMGYAVATVLGLIILITVLAGKKGPQTLGRASFIEILSMLFLLPLFCIILSGIVNEGYEVYKWNPGLVIAAGGTFLMMLVQAFVYKKGSGFMKFFLALLSVVVLLLCVFDITAVIPALDKPLNDLYGKLGDKFVYGAWYEGGTVVGDPLAHLMIFFSDVNYFTAYLGEVTEITDKVMAISLLIGGFLIIMNTILDILGIAKKTNKGMLGFNIFRFFLELAAAAIVLVLQLTITKGKLGIPLLAVVAVSALQFIINIIRAVAYKRHMRKLAAEREAQRRQQMQMSRAQQYGGGRKKSDPAMAQQLAESEAAREAKRKEREDRRQQKDAERAARLNSVSKPAEQPAEPENVYTVSQIYKGPTDEFIDTLSNNEKIEFARNFIEDRKGALKQLPNYVIEGNNDKFFSSIFIYYGSICGLISSGLMGKFYDRLYKDKA